MSTAEVTKQDVLDVAKSLGKTVTDGQAQFIVDEYPAWQSTDPAANWTSIIEDLIYFTLETGPFDQLGYEQTEEDE